MLFQTASSELPLLLFSVLLPMGLAGAALTSLVRGLVAEQGEAAGKKLDILATIPVAVALVGLVCAVFHLGSPAHMFGMAAGIGASPLTNEIMVAGVAIVLLVVFWLVGLLKHSGKSVQLIFGAVLAVAAVAVAVATGLAYAIPTIVTWNTPYGWLGQVFLTLVGGSALAAFVLALGGIADKKAGALLAACAVVGAVGAAVVVFVQGSFAASVITSAGTTLAAVMGDYNLFAGIGSVLVIAGAALVATCAVKFAEPKPAFAVIALVLVLVGLLLIRADFYGIYTTVGLA